MALIKCPECGKEISEKADSCPNCGYPIGHNSTTVEEPVTQAINVEKPKKKHIKIIISVVVVLMLVVLAVVFFLHNKKVAVEGRYYSIFNEGMNDSYFDFSPSNDKKTQGTYRDVIYAPTDDKGTEFSYEIDGNILKAQTLIGTCDYTIYKNYLIPLEYSYEGKIPSGNTFNVECTSGDSKIDFKSDGTVCYDGDNGTYKRDGDKVKLSIDGKKYTLVFLVYNDQLNNCVCEKHNK